MHSLSSLAHNIPVMLAAQASSADSMNPILLVVLALIVVIVLAGGWYFLRKRTSSPLEADVTEAVRPAAVAKKSGWAGGKTTSVGVIATLEIMDGPEGKVDGTNAGRKVEIYSGRVRIGRSSELCDLQLYDIDDNSTVSRRHCTIEFDRTLNTFVIIDEGSRSGTRVGGTMIEAHQRFPLKDGDVIELGFVEQSGARLRFTSPIARAAVRPQSPSVLETASVETAPPPAAIIRTQKPDIPVDPNALTGVETEMRRQQNPLALPGTGPLSHPHEPCEVFLSYSRKDKEIMLRISADLRVNNVSVWTDENLTPGTPLWRQAIEIAIEKANCVVVILSPDGKQSPWVQRELDYAVTQDKPIIPLLVRGDEKTAIPLTLISAQWADLRADYDLQFSAVLNTVKQTIEETRTGQS
ncbi:MAG: TIR domain-containing protein [Anaerolineae bacterium]